MDSIDEHFQLFILIVFLMTGLGAFLCSIYYYVKSEKALSWHVTEGTILTSDVVKETDHDSDRINTTMYKAEICYSYTILKEKFVSDNIRFMPKFSTSSSKAAYRRTLKYSPGMTVEVYYNPANPEEAVLEPGIKEDHIIFLVISGLVFLIA